MKTYKFDTTIESERIKLLSKMAKRANYVGYVNTRTEEFISKEGNLYLYMDEIGTYSAKCELRFCANDRLVLRSSIIENY